MKDMQALFDYIALKEDESFEWGKADCCIFVADAILVMTGDDPMVKFRDRYTDERSGRALMRQQGGLARILTDLFGRSRAVGEKGDVAYCDFPDGSAVGIHLGNAVAFKAKKGLVSVPVEDCKFFKVV